jgi:hypothetical protein
MTPATLFIAACACVIAEVTATSDVVFGRLITGRSILEPVLQEVVGPCVNFVPVRVTSALALRFQPPYMAVQTVLPESLVSTALVMLSFTQQFGGIVILSIAQNVFLNRLGHNLATQVLGLDDRALLSSGATVLVASVPLEFRDQALLAYNRAIVYVLYIALGLTCLVLVSTIGIEWKSVKTRKAR